MLNDCARGRVGKAQVKGPIILQGLLGQVNWKM